MDEPGTVDVVHGTEGVVEQYFDVLLIEHLVKLLAVKQAQQIVRQVLHHYKNIFKWLILAVHVVWDVLILLRKDDIKDLACENVVLDLRELAEDVNLTEEALGLVAVLHDILHKLDGNYFILLDVFGLDHLAIGALAQNIQQFILAEDVVPDGSEMQDSLQGSLLGPWLWRVASVATEAAILLACGFKLHLICWTLSNYYEKMENQSL